jgi:hypothetical protein
MIENKCSNCNNDLFLKDKDELWCPKCDEIDYLSEEKSLIICKNILLELKNEVKEICNVFSFEDLLFIGTNSREVLCLKEEKDLYVSWDVKEILESTFIIKNALSGMHGVLSQKDCNHQLVSLYKRIKDQIFLENTQVLIEQNYGFFFKLTDKLKVSYPLDKYYSFIFQNEEYFFVYKSSWLNYLKNLKENNICRKEELIEVARKNLVKMKLAELRAKRGKKEYQDSFKKKRSLETMEMILNALCSTYYDLNMFAFSELNEDVLSFLGEITSFARKEVSKFDKPQAIKISKQKFFELAKKHGDTSKLYESLVSNKDDIKNFPIIIENNDDLVLCPETMFLVWCILRYRLNKELVNNLLTGEDFEQKVQDKLISFGFSTKDPLNPKLDLKGRKIKIRKIIDGKEEIKEREIDLIAYNEETIFVIECKDWSMVPKLFWRYQQDYRIKDIEMEIDEKHIDRVDFVKENYKSYFGFKNEYEIKSILVTRIKEKIEEHNNTKIISEFELEKLKH